MAVVRLFKNDQWATDGRVDRFLVGDNVSKGDPYMQFTLPSTGKKISLVVFASTGRLLIQDSTNNQTIATIADDAAKTYTNEEYITGLSNYFTISDVCAIKSGRIVQIYMDITAKKNIDSGTTIGTVADGLRPVRGIGFYDYFANNNVGIRLGAAGAMATSPAIASGKHFYIGCVYISNKF